MLCTCPYLNLERLFNQMENLFYYLSQHALLLYGLVFIYSLCVGSFLNVVIYRLPLILNAKWTVLCSEFLNIQPAQVDKVSLAFPRSACPKCKRPVKAWQNIPVISYILLRGKCFECNAYISLRYPFVELLTACLSVLIFYYFGLSLQSGVALILLYTLIVLTFIDIDTQLLPDNITIPLIWIGLLINTQSIFVSLPNAVFSAVGAYLVLWSFLKVFYLLTGKEGMGEGDLKLFSAFGAWLGWQVLPLIILLASILGAIIGMAILYFQKQDKDTPLPFGPYLCIAGFVALLWGKPIIHWYLSTVYS